MKIYWLTITPLLTINAATAAHVGTPGWAQWIAPLCIVTAYFCGRLEEIRWQVNHGKM